MSISGQKPTVNYDFFQKIEKTVKNTDFATGVVPQWLYMVQNKMKSVLEINLHLFVLEFQSLHAILLRPPETWIIPEFNQVYKPSKPITKRKQRGTQKIMVWPWCFY